MAGDNFDLVVLGAGAAGLVTAAGAAKIGAKVALIERRRFGGECLWTGCVPSKALIRSAKLKRLAERAGGFGIRTGPVEADFPSVMKRMREVISAIQPHDDPARFQKMGVETIQGEARFIGPDRVEVNGRVLRAFRFVVATGADPAVPPIPGVSEVPFLTFENFFEQETKPESLLIVGGGPIGCEMGQAFHRFGAKVTIVETLECILNKDDREVSCLLYEILKKEGIRIEVNARAEKIRREGNRIILTCRRGNESMDLEGERVLFATGKRPRVNGLGLEKAGVEYDEGGIRVDETLRTTNPRVYAAGDVAGSYQFTHYAEHQAGVVLFNAFSPLPFLRRKADVRVVPWCTYTDPELAHVGLTEAEAKKEFGEDGYKVWRYKPQENDRHVIDGETEGIVKLLTKTDGEILGCTILSAGAGELIHEYALALRKRLKAHELSGLIHAYPTHAQANKRAADLFMADKYLGGFLPKAIRAWLRIRRPS